jgi:guanylate kinase
VKPFLLVLSSPSGGGKTTIARRLLASRPVTAYSVSATTRLRRPGEEEGKDYYFLEAADFQRREAQGEFLETATYNGERYGTLAKEIERILGLGRIPVLDIDIEGARQLRRSFPNSVQVFILPPSGAVLIQRLKARKTEAPESLRRRLEHASEELQAALEYDYTIINDDLDAAVAQVAAILDAETRRTERQEGLRDFIELLRQEVGEELVTLSIAERSRR